MMFASESADRERARFASIRESIFRPLHVQVAFSYSLNEVQELIDKVPTYRFQTFHDWKV